MIITDDNGAVLAATTYKIGDSVHLDGDTSSTFVVTGIWLRVGQVQVEVSWMSNGDHKTAWVDDFRIRKAVH